MVDQAIRERILSRVEECKVIYEDRGFFSVGDVARYDFSVKDVQEVLKEWKQVGYGFYYINENWRKNESHHKKIKIQKKLF